METTNQIFILRQFNCSASELFKWLVNPELISKWFGPKHLTVGIVQMVLKVGGRYSIELEKTDDSVFYIEGMYLEITPPNRLKFTFCYKGLSKLPPDSTVDIRISRLDDTKCQLTLIQKFVSLPSDMDKRRESWEYMLQVLNEKM